jgi:hypothetical protein
VSAVLVIAVVLLMVATLAGTLLIFPAMWRGFSDQWRRFPPHRRRRGLAGGALTALLMVVAAVLAIAAPWGRYSVLYVIGVGGGALMLLALGGTAVQAVQDARRAKQARAARARSRPANE